MTSKPSDLRASDGDREHVVEVLREAVGEGRLTLEEYEERADKAYNAKTLGELATLTADLPGQHERQPLPALDSGPITAIFSNVKRNGRWLVPSHLRVTAALGEVKLDLCDAVLQGREVTIEVWALLGNVEIVVPEGVDVQLRGTAIAATKESKMASVADSRAPRVIVEATCVLASVKVRPPRRSWMQRR